MMKIYNKSIWVILFSVFASNFVFGQNINCVQKLNLGTNATTDQACFKLSEVVKNPDSYPVDLALENVTADLLSRIHIDGSLISESNRNGLSLATEVCIDACGLDELRIQFSNSSSSCWTNFTFKQSGIPFLESKLTTNSYYTIETIPVVKPTVSASCDEATEGLTYFDWVQSIPCESGVQDTQSIIFREWEVYSKKSGIRTSIVDTIYVFYLPKLTAKNFKGLLKTEEYCVIKSGIDLPGSRVAFNLRYPRLFSNSSCQSKRMDQIQFYEGSGVILFYKDSILTNSCPKLVKRTAQVKQYCWSSIKNNCEGDENEIVTDADEENGYFELEQWVTLIDTIPSIFTSKPENFEIGFTSDHGCETDVYAPSIKVLDNCSGTESVIAYIPGYHSQKLTTLIDLPIGSETWQKSDSTKAWSLAPGTYPILYVATDSCGNVGQYKDTTWVTVVDNIPPLAIADKNVNIALDNKEIWVDIDDFDEGSSDNCGLRFVLGRRTDWATACGVNFCDKKSNSVEDYYDDVMFWLEDDGEPCTEFVLNGWRNGIKAYKEKNCGKVDEHGNPVSTTIDRGIDGGWAQKIPFCCEDACKEVIVELLAVDKNCNYSKAWITVKVEENQTPQKISDFSDYPISCTTMSEYEDIIDAAKSAGNSAENPKAFNQLNDIFGDVLTGWAGTNNTNPIVDINGKPINTSWDYITSECYFDYTEQKVAVEGHDGEIEWVIQRDTIVKVKNEKKVAQLGAIINLCGDVTAVQDIWDQRNECGVGTITRRWTISSGCSDHNSESLKIEQKIIVTQDCEFNKYMFTLSGDNYVCRYLNYDLDGNVNLTGAVDLVFNGDLSCRQVGIGYTDKVFEISGKNNMYKIERTWEVSDWCINKTEKFVQKIILDETCVNDDQFGFVDNKVKRSDVKQSLGLHQDEEDTFAALAIPSAEKTTVKAYPNPFLDYVTISISSSTDNPLTLVITDVYGKERFNKTIESSSGITDIVVSSNDLGANGVYYYNIIEKGTQTATGKLFFIN